MQTVLFFQSTKSNSDFTMYCPSSLVQVSVAAVIKFSEPTPFHLYSSISKDKVKPKAAKIPL